MTHPQVPTITEVHGVPCRPVQKCSTSHHWTEWSDDFPGGSWIRTFLSAHLAFGRAARWLNVQQWQQLQPDTNGEQLAGTHLESSCSSLSAKILAESQPDRRAQEMQGSARRQDCWSRPQFTCHFVGTRSTCISLWCFCTDIGTPVNVLKNTVHRTPGDKQTLAKTNSKSKTSVPSPKLS